MKRISLFESWGIESTAAKSLALLPHVQAYSDNFLKELLAYASKRSKDNLPGYLRSMLEMPNLVLYSLSLIHISEPTRHICLSRMPSSA